ncbi:ABC transporter substrate-binding protein [Arthrobacter crystallopoietes]|uniref:ABC transporter substrate-binding protein n=1 Tax=Crystallibacter crystallopoietes TaxID=37928 RepID=UPI00111133BE|nr:ABC transporter substrate-binding protein [Arthrobacter crystallopoietes]
MAISGWNKYMMSQSEFTADHHGHATVLMGTAPVAELIQLARGFLLVNRTEAQFIFRTSGPWLAVRMERHRGRGDQQDHALVSTSYAVLPLGITKREIDVLTLVSLGLTNIEIAERLGTSPRTVSTQIERLLQKLDQRGRAGLAALAVDSNLLALPVPGGVDGVVPIAAVGLEKFARMLAGNHDRVSALAALPPMRRPILLGTLASLSGNATDDGEEHVRGSALAVEEINANGGIAGRPLEHIVADADLFSPTDVRGAMQRLIDARVDAITTNYISAENPFILDMAADYGHPFLHLDTFEQHVDLVRDQPERYWMIYQTCPSEKYYAMAFRRFLQELEDSRRYTPVNRRVAIVEMDSPSTRITGNGFESALSSVGWSICSKVSAPFRQTDWRKIARKISASNPDVVLVAHFIPDEIALFHRLLKEHGFTGLVHYVYGASIPRFKELLGPLADGAVWSSVTSRTDSASATKFHRDYLLRYGIEPGPSQASAAYDQVQLLAWSWARNGSTIPSGTCKVLREETYRGLNGIYYFGSGGQSPLSYPDGTADPTLGQVLITSQIQNGRSVVISPPLFGAMNRLQAPTR